MFFFKIYISMAENSLWLCLCGVYFPLENVSLLWRRHHCPWRAVNFDLCSALMAIEQWGLFNLPQLLCHGPTHYNGYLRGPVTHTPVVQRLQVELSLPVFTTQVCRDRGSNPDFPHARRTLYLYTTAAEKRKYQPFVMMCKKA